MHEVKGLSEAGVYYATAYKEGWTPASAKSAAYTVAEEGGVVDKASTFANGTVTSAQDNIGRAIAATDGVFSFQYDGSVHYVKPLKVTTSVDSEAVDVNVDALAYFADTNENGVYDKGYDQSIEKDSIKNVGTYFVVAQPAADATDYAGAENVSKFVISAGSFGTVTAYEGDDVNDTEFAFTNEALDIKFANNGVALGADDYDVTWKSSDGVDVTGGVKNAGTYTATITGKKAYEGSKATVDVTVAKYDLSTAGLTVADIAATDDSLPIDFGNSGTLTFENGIDGLASLVDFAITGNKIPNEKGSYTVTVTPKEESAGNVEGTARVAVNVVDAVVPAASFMYDSDALSEIDGKTFDASKGEAFDASKIKVVRATIGTTNYYYDASAYTVTLYDEDGNVVSAANAGGEYTVVVSMNPGSDFAVGGKESAEFKVINGSIKNAVVTATYDGKVLPGSSVTYTGEDVIAGMDLTVKLGDTELVEGTDYKVTVTNGKGEEVESAVDAGSYYVKVEGLTYDGVANFGFSIAKVSITGVKVDTGNMGVLAWTGEAIVPTVLYTTETAPFDEDTEWTALPADVYKATWKLDGKSVEEVVEEGDYELGSFAIYSDVKNYEANTPNTDGMAFKVSKAVAFADVAADAWYADEIALASQTTPVKYGYMTGIPGTNLFMPEASITRAQTAQVLFNMAGGVSKTGYYPTAFSDVNGWAWYAQPIAWASQASIVTGIGDTGAFAPDENVTREQAATMLYRYVKAQGKDASATADLSQYTDGASVSDWAAEAMQWAVANDVFGVNTDQLRPQEDLSRAEMAAIAVRVQPDGAYEKL